MNKQIIRIFPSKYAELIIFDANEKEKGRYRFDIRHVDKIRTYRWHIWNGYAMTSGGTYSHPKGVTLGRMILNHPEDKIIRHIDGNRKNNLDNNLVIKQ